MPSLVATMSALACKMCVRTHFVRTNSSSIERKLRGLEIAILGLKTNCEGDNCILNSYKTLTQDKLFLHETLLVHKHQDKVELSCTPLNISHIPAIHGALGTLQAERIVFESGKSIKLTNLENEIRPIRQSDIMLDNYVLVKHQETLSVICLNESLVILNNRAVSCKSLQTLKINDPDKFILETKNGRVTATSHREHFNIDLFKEHSHHFTDEKRDKTRQDIIMEKATNTFLQEWGCLT